MCNVIGGDFTRGDGTGGKSGTADPTGVHCTRLRVACDLTMILSDREKYLRR